MTETFTNMRCPDCGLSMCPEEGGCPNCETEKEDESVDTDKLHKWNELNERKTKIEADLTEVKNMMSSLEEEIIDEMTDEEVDKITVGGRTFFPQTQVVANIKNKQAAIKALKDAGFTEYLGESYNTNQISAYVRERVDSGEALPKEFEGIIEPFEKPKLGARKG